jgi:hypothetical protein
MWAWENTRLREVPSFHHLDICSSADEISVDESFDELRLRRVRRPDRLVERQ